MATAEMLTARLVSTSDTSSAPRAPPSAPASCGSDMSVATPALAALKPKSTKRSVRKGASASARRFTRSSSRRLRGVGGGALTWSARRAPPAFGGHARGRSSGSGRRPPAARAPARHGPRAAVALRPPASGLAAHLSSSCAVARGGGARGRRGCAVDADREPCRRCRAPPADERRQAIMTSQWAGYRGLGRTARRSGGSGARTGLCGLEVVSGVRFVAKNMRYHPAHAVKRRGPRRGGSGGATSAAGHQDGRVKLSRGIQSSPNASSTRIQPP